MESCNQFYVYLLLDPRKFYTPFYVGKGSGDRSRTTVRDRSSNKMKTRVIYKIRKAGHEPVVMMWETELSEQEAFTIEISLIKRWGRRDLKTGILTNLSDGGEGVKGCAFSKEARARMSAAHIGKKRTTPVSNETRLKIGEASRNAWIRRKANGLYKVNFTEEYLRKLREENPAGLAMAIPVFQIDTFSGKVIHEWPSSKAAGDSLGIAYGNITKQSKDGSFRAPGGFYWRRLDSREMSGDFMITYIECNIRRARGKTHNNIKIRQTTETGEEIRIWDSLLEASRELSIGYGTLYSAAKQGRMLCGYYWQRIE